MSFKEISFTRSRRSVLPLSIALLFAAAVLLPVAELSAQDYSSSAYTMQPVLPRATVTAEPVNAPLFGGAARTYSAETPSESRPERRRSASTTTSTSAAVADAKSVPKDVVKLVAPSRPIFTLSAGYQTTYVYHGLDVIGANSSVANIERTVDPFYADSGFLPLGRVTNVVNGLTSGKLTSDIVFVTGGLDWQGFHLSVGFTRALQSTVPYRTTLAFLQSGLTLQSPYNLYFRGNQTPPPLKEDNYQEVTIGLNYTYALTPALSATIGFNNFILPVKAFRNTNYLGEGLVRLTYAPGYFPYIKATLSYYRYFSGARVPQLQSNVLDNFFVDGPVGSQAANQSQSLANGPQYLTGGYGDLRIDGDIPIAKSGRFSLRLQPYVLVSYNNGFFSRLTTASPIASGPFFLPRGGGLVNYASNNGIRRNTFNTFEVGAQLRFAYGRLSVTPSVNYGVDISQNGDANSFSNNGNAGQQKNVWGGVVVGCTF